MHTLLDHARPNGSDASRTRLQVATVTGPWCSAATHVVMPGTLTANVVIAKLAASGLMTKRSTFARKYHAQRPEEVPTG